MSRDFLPFVDQRLKVGWSEEFGYGVFAKEHISKGEFVEIAPVVILDDMPEGDLARYVIAWNGRLAVSLGWTMLYNHSDQNSCVYSSNFHEGLLGIMTAREILPGEQLTVDYGPDWFSSRNIEKVLF